MSEGLSADVVICGAGIAGVSAAYHLAVRQGVGNVVLVDERAPLTLTSDKGTEAYRNWWPGPGDTMVRFMSRSIDLLEEQAAESGNAFRLNRRGYVFLTADPAGPAALERSAAEISALGAGPLRKHPGPEPYVPSPPAGFETVPAGADLLLDRDRIRRGWPFITEGVVAALHVRRAGWLDTRRLGRWLLERGRARGVRLLRDRVDGVRLARNRVHEVRLRSGDRIATGAFVIAAGPHLASVARQLGLSLPVVNELHGKVALRDSAGIVPRDAPLLIWNDPVSLPWSAAERRGILSDGESRLLDVFPPGVHVRPRDRAGARQALIVWTYERRVEDPVWPPRFDGRYAEVLLRGLARMIPGLAVYFGRGREAVVDGGYYCKTAENRPLIGPLPVGGGYVIGALSGYGVMASQAAGELIAAHVTGSALPAYAPDFQLDRYERPEYRSLMARADATSGQI